MPPDFFHTKQQQRILEIDRMLRKPGGKTREHICTVLAKRGFASSRHTFMRDMDHMRYELGAPIGYEDRIAPEAPQGHTTFWFYRDPSWTLKTFRLTEETLFGLFVAREVVERYAGHPLAEELKAVYDKLGETLNRKVTLSSDRLAPLSFLPEPQQPIEAAVWKAVLKATTEQRMLSMTYSSKWKEGSAKVSTRTVHPYHIVNLSGAWYLVASKSETDLEVRQYAITGMRDAKVLTTRATIPSDFDIRKILDCTFGRFLGDSRQTVEVRLRFKKRVGPLLKDRVFSRRQNIKTLKSGDIEMTFPVSSEGPWPLYHVKGWVLSWGPDCDVLGPPELQELVRKDVEKMMKNNRKENWRHAVQS
jgi:predicted DNA-binding transcriptional regulator YafY